MSAQTIRVIARFRPLNRLELQHNGKPCVQFRALSLAFSVGLRFLEHAELARTVKQFQLRFVNFYPNSLAILFTKSRTEGKKEFVFDHAFPMTSSQEEGLSGASPRHFAFNEALAEHSL